MVLEEAQERPGGEGPDLGKGRRPDGAAHGQDEMAEEAVRVAAALEEAAQGEVAPCAPVAAEEHPGLPVEAGDVGEQAQVRRIQRAATLGEEARGSAARVLEATAPAAHAEGHVARAAADAQLGQKLDEAGVGAVVVDDETAVHAQSPAADRHVVGVGVPAQAGLGLEERHAVPPGQVVGGREAGDPRSDDAHAQAAHAAYSVRRGSYAWAGTGWTSQASPSAASARIVHQVGSISHQ